MTMQPRTSAETKLPANLFSDYEWYKQNTRIAKRWLIENGSMGDARRYNSVPVKELASLAKVVEHKKVDVPNEAIRALIRTIQKHRKITNFFKAGGEKSRSHEDEVTSSHGYFSARQVLCFLTFAL